MKKVLLLVTKSNFGGAQRYVYDLATNLPKDRYKVTVAAGGNGTLFNKLEKQGIRTLSIPHMGRDISITEEIKSLFYLIKLIWRERPDVVHVNSPKISGLTSVVSRLLRVKKIVQTIHGWSFNEQRTAWQIVLIKSFSWLTAFLVTDIILLNKKEKLQIKKWPLISKKITIIPNTINIPDYLERDAAKTFLFAEAGIPSDDSTIIVSIGELTLNKDYSTALQAISKLDLPFHYFIIGEGEDKKKIVEEIKELGLEKKVHLLGLIPNASNYLQAADLFLLTSRKEGLPYVLMEAALAKCPIVATDVGGIRELLEGNAILTPKESPQTITEAIMKTMQNQDQTTRGAIELYNRIKNYPLEEMVEKIISIYK